MVGDTLPLEDQAHGGHTLDILASRRQISDDRGTRVLIHLLADPVLVIKSSQIGHP
jgi:hypothetical protein